MRSTAGIYGHANRFLCCLPPNPDDTHTRYLSAPPLPAALLALTHSLASRRINEVALADTQAASTSLASFLYGAGIDVWLTPYQLLADLAAVAATRPGPRTLAAILARLCPITTWRAQMRLWEPPVLPPQQLSLLDPRASR